MSGDLIKANSRKVLQSGFSLYLHVLRIALNSVKIRNFSSNFSNASNLWIQHTDSSKHPCCIFSFSLSLCSFYLSIYYILSISQSSIYLFSIYLLIYLSS